MNENHLHQQAEKPKGSSPKDLNERNDTTTVRNAPSYQAHTPKEKMTDEKVNGYTKDSSKPVVPVKDKQQQQQQHVDGKIADNVKNSPKPVGPAKDEKQLNEGSYSKQESHYPWETIGAFNEGVKFDRSIISDANIVKAYITEVYYSDFYCNTVLIFGTCVFSWLTSRLRFGLIGLVITLLVAASFYKAEFRRFKRNIRDDLKRITATERVEGKLESMEWMNSFLAKFWVIYMPALSDTVKTIANDTLKDVAPGYGIEALTLNEFTLGSKAPRINSITSYTKKGKDLVEMDWSFSFTPDDTSDMTKREIEKKVNPKVALGVRVGKAFISKSLPILVEDMSVTGRVKITLKLSNIFPHIKMVSIQLLEPPKIDFALKPVGGDTFGLDIMSLIPGLSSLITTLINSNVGPMLYAPNHLDVDVEELMEQQSKDAIGVVAVTVRGCSELKRPLNAYVQVSLEADPAKHIRTGVKGHSKEPRWNETKYILVNDLQQKLTFQLFDFNLNKKKGEIYAAHDFELTELLQNNTVANVEKNLTVSGSKKGKINYDVRWYPTLTENEDETTGETETSETEIPDSEVGIFKFKLHQAKGLDNTLAITGQLSPKAELFVNGQLVHTFRTLKASNEPSWEESLELFITQKANTKIKLTLTDTLSGSEIGVLEDTLDTFAFNVSQGEDTFKLSTQGNVRLFAGFKPVSLSGVSSGAASIPPIGVARLHLRSARDLLNLEKFGKVDPYVKVLLANRLKYRTAFHPDILEPEFNEVTFVPIVSTSQQITLEVMDDQNLTKDRTLGSANIPVSEIIRRNSNGSLLFYDGSNHISTKKLQRKHKAPKGEISYSISFLPTIPVYSLEELDELEQRKEVIAEKKAKQAQELKDWEDLYKKNPKEYEWVEVEDYEDYDDGTKKEKLSLDQLLTYRSGVLAIHIAGGKVKKNNSFIQVVLDDYASPSFVSSASDSKTVNLEVGYAFIRDLPNSRIIFRNTKKPHIRDADEILDESSFNTIDLLKKAYSKPTILSIGSCQLKVRFEYIPSAIKLPASETLLDTGRAQIEFLDAEDLPSHDRNGKSDPFVVVSLGDVELFKSKVVRKTLNPTFKEGTTLPIPSRARSLLELKVFDWDRAGANDLLCSTRLDISKVKPLDSEIITFSLKPKGELRARVTFSPEYVRPKVGAREFGAGLSALTGVPLKGVGTAVNLAGGVVGGGAELTSSALGAGAGVAGGVASMGGSLFKSVLGGKKGKQSLDQPRASGENYGADVHSLRSGRSRKHNGAGDNESSNDKNGVITMPSPDDSKSSADISTYSTAVQGMTSTTGKLKLVSATNLGNHALLKVSLSINGKSKRIYKTKNAKSHDGRIKWDEEVEFDAPQEAEISICGVLHRTLGKDHELGTATVKLAEVVDNPRDITLDLGPGKLELNVNYSPEPASDGEIKPPKGWEV